MLEIKSKNYQFTLRKSAGKFMHTSVNQNSDGQLSKYLIADCIDPDATKAFGVQTRKIVKTFFEGSMVFDQLKEAIQAGIIDKESGVSAKPLAGYFVDLDCGFTYRTTLADGRTFDATTVSLFIMAGENYAVVKARAIRAVEKLRITSVEDIQAGTEIKESAETNAPTAPAAADDEF